MCWFPSSVYKSLDRTRLSGHLLSALFQLFLLCNHSSDCVSVALSHGLLMLKARVDGGGGRNPVGELVSSLDLQLPRLVSCFLLVPQFCANARCIMKLQLLPKWITM